MTREQYKTIWEQTEKAANYLRKKGLDYYTSDYKSGYETYLLIGWHFAGTTEKQRQHIAKRYPDALIFYADADAVTAENTKREEAFWRMIESMPTIPARA